MERRPVTRGGAARKNNRRLMTLLWITGLAILVIALIYFEQTAILYVLATLGLTALLIIVALSDLSGRGRGTNLSELGDDSAAISDGVTGTSAAAVAITAPTTSRRRPAAKRR